MQYEFLRLQQEKAVVTLTIGRPQQFNALGLACLKELSDAANRVAEDASVRAVVLTGAGGRAFCVGGDVADMAREPADSALLLNEMTVYLHRAIANFVSMPAPVIAAVNGVAAGAGLGLVMSADLAIASEQARFTSAYTQIGLSPDAGTSFLLPRIVGLRRASELMIVNRTLTAAEAQEWGLVSRVVPHADCLREAERLAHQLAAGPTGAFARVKRLIQAAEIAGLVSHMELEAQNIAESSRSKDGQEGVAAFAGKRKPQFFGN